MLSTFINTWLVLYTRKMPWRQWPAIQILKEQNNKYCQKCGKNAFSTGQVVVLIVLGQFGVVFC